jgi:uncharacterized protein YbcC (UPF0753/DUF2309 family)
MNDRLGEVLIEESTMAKAIQEVCDCIAPTWPLDQMIAVNPYWRRAQQPFKLAAQELARIAGSPLAMPYSYYRERWEAGEICKSHLARAIDEFQSPLTVKALLDHLDTPERELVPAPLLCDALDSKRDLSLEPAWCDTITHQISQFCASYFDRAQAGWHPDQKSGLYSGWRGVMTRDHGVALLMRAPFIPAKAGTLSEDPDELIAYAMEKLAIPREEWATYLQAVIMRISGWASWCGYLRWQARLSGGEDQSVKDLLAIRLGWECLIDDEERDPQSVWQGWRDAWGVHFQLAQDPLPTPRLIWLRAHEIAYQQELCIKLLTSPRVAAQEPKVQAVFCIDVRSEVLRRHFEAQSPHIQTLGFAGFFGLPISYTPLGTQATRPQLPGLLAPELEVSDSCGDQDQDIRLASRRIYRLRIELGLRTFLTTPASAFALVESLGLSYAGKLVRRSLPGRPAHACPNAAGLKTAEARRLRPLLRAAQVGGTKGQAELAARVLTGMQLTKNFAPLVLLIGHGSQSDNNPQRAGLDCGACCGQTGEVNSRVLAGMLNDLEVRRQLEGIGIRIPTSTRFLAGLHNTTTDEVQLFDVDESLDSLGNELEEVRAQLAAASWSARRERAPLLGLHAFEQQPDKLLHALRKRTSDWAQTRPEWGLANNAAFIVAPRSVTRSINLAGRSFLHEYDYRADPDGRILAQIMTAPMIVTNWINMQYFASSVDNLRYGSGNKTLHNVVGGRLGIFEGNGGDLRIGLAKQSVHDGQSWRHAPLRLTVVIEAPRAAIEQVISAHAEVSNLITNQWLYLARLEGSQVEFFHDGGWITWAS